MLPDTTITCFTEWIRNSLQAHDEDLAGELASSEDGKASATFKLSITRNKHNAKFKVAAKCSIARSPMVVETLLPDLDQLQLPGM